MPSVTETQGVSAAQAHFKLAKSLQSEGRVAEAAGQWVAGLQIDPSSELAHLSLADALLELKLFQPASIACEHALMVTPESPAAYERLGRAMEGLGDRTQAIAHYTRSLSLGPDRAVSHRLAAALRAEGKLDSARRVLEVVCDRDSRDVESLFLLAGVLGEMGSPEEAERRLRKAISHQPRFPEALNNLAILLRASGQTREAEVCLRKAVGIRPGYAAAWNNLANLHVELSRIDEAIQCYTKAISLEPEYAEAHTNRALALLLSGHFEEGWQEFEWRWKQPGAAARTLGKPEWDGSDVRGKRILLHAEQGAGDTIQFVRYARLLHQQGAKVLVHCQESLRSLLEGAPYLTQVFSGPISGAAFDVHAPLMSLPRLFGTRPDCIPEDVPYLEPVPGSAAPEELTSSRAFRVGLVWAGNPSHRNDRNRSIGLSLLEDTVRIEGIRFFSLQLGRTPADEQWMSSRAIVDLAPYLSDYAATAACVQQLDVLVTVDTSVAHLAGALGKPVWMLLPTCNDWRWQQKGEDSPWYPSMRLYRQTRLRDWKPVTQRIASDLRREASGNGWLKGD